ncbi:MAG: sulfatase-like hydrolase/transferase [Planctomycetota bacterium]|jgi:arylsulfatase A-like enzyme
MSQQPNIVFLFTDDQRYNTIAALGNEEILTPNLDKLVARGTTFTHSHIMGGSSPAVCMPSRAMLNTGRTLYEIQGMGQEIPEDHALIGETLQRAGYKTWGSGKWHSGRRAFARSFGDGDEIFFGGMCDHWNVPAYHYDPTGEYAQRPQITDPWKTRDVTYTDGDHINRGEHSTDSIANAAIDYIQNYEEDKPFYMYCSFLAPHDPRSMPEKYMKLYENRSVSLPENFAHIHPFDNGELRIRDEMLAGHPRKESEVLEHLMEYYAMITHLDDVMGQVIDAVEAKGELDNTVFVMSGDNGLAVGCHGLMGKQSLYDHSVRVPLIFAGPGIPQNETRNQFSLLSDLFPTFCDLAGCDTPKTVTGTSLKPILDDAAAPLRDQLYLVYKDCHRGIRERRFKLIEYVVEGENTRTQLFDLEVDPNEMKDLIDDPAYADEAARLRADLRRLSQEYNDTREQGQYFWGAMEG